MLVYLTSQGIGEQIIASQMAIRTALSLLHDGKPDLDSALSLTPGDEREVGLMAILKDNGTRRACSSRA
jgi:hypothetical protein